MNASTEKIPDWFSTLILGLKERYPGCKIEATTVAVWWDGLKNIDPESIRVGIEAASYESPMFVPSEPSVRQKSIEYQNKRAKHRESHKRQLLLGEGCDGGYPYISKENPGYALAMKWRKESEQTGMKPNDVVPSQLAKERTREIMKLLGLE